MSDGSRSLAITVRAAAAAVFSFALVATPAAAAVVCPTEWELQVVDLINSERARAGAPALEIDVRLVASARGHSEDMAAGRFLSHTGSDGSSPFDRMRDAGYASPGGETAGAGQWAPQVIVDGWMNSSGHRAILLDARYVHVGVGYATNPQLLSSMWSHLWTANFGLSPNPAHTVEQYCDGGSGPPPECDDGLDNDGDGKVDVSDTGCLAPWDVSERPTCADGLDNDGDGKTDMADSFCSTPGYWTEGPLCSNGFDEDGDGLIDWPADPGCSSPDQLSEMDPACGFGFELALLLPPLMAWRKRRRHAEPSDPAPPHGRTSCS